MQIGNLQVHNFLALGPMAGVTDWAFRTICAQLGAGVTVTEMVSSRALVYKDKKSAALLRKNEGSLCGAQIFGNDPDIMAEGARLALEISGCDFLDINMGCPMPKIANNGDGCGLMRTPELAEQIVKAVTKAVDVPVTVKCRLGWDKGSINVLDFAKRMEDSGAALLTVHGRTRSMLYSGVADWDMIAKVKQELSVPVIANGDIVDGQSAVRCRNWTKADGFMIGRATFGNPWVFDEIKAYFEGREFTPPTTEERIASAIGLVSAIVDLKGEDRGIREARGRAAHFIRGMRGSAEIRAALNSSTSLQEFKSILENYI